MSNIGLDLSDCLNYLDSSRKQERRKRIEDLKDILENSHVGEFLNKNSETKTGVSWGSVFNALHACLTHEAECFCSETSKGKLTSTTDKAVRGCCGLLVQVVRDANAGRPYLPCQELFSCILQICEAAESDDVVLKSIFGETYINLLGMAISCEKYWGEISLQTWKCVLKLCVNLVDKVRSEKNKATILSIFNVILLQGGRLSHVVLKSKQFLVLFPDIMSNLMTNKYSTIELSSLHLCRTICIQFGKEFRLSVCLFIDRVLPQIMSLNDLRICDVPFKELVATVLIEMVGIRMVDGKWKDEAKSLLSFAEKEIGEICRHKLNVPHLPKMVVLAVKLVKQVHLDKGGSEEYIEPSSSKRLKVTSCIGNILDNIKIHYNFSWPWLCYLDHLLEKAPEVLLDEDFPPLLRYLTESLPSCSEHLPLHFLAKSSIRLLKFSMGNNVPVNEKVLQDLQNVLWATVLRCLSIPPLLEVGLQLAIDLLPDWTIQESAKVLTDHFIEGKLAVSKTSLTTLTYLSSTGMITSTRDRITLIEWCLTGNEYSSDTLFSLVIRTKLPLPDKKYQSELVQTECEHFYLINSFDSPPTKSSSKDLVPLKAVQDDREACEVILNSIFDRISDIGNLSQLLSFVATLYSFHTKLSENNLTIANRLRDILERTVTSVLPRLEEELRPQNFESLTPVIVAAGDFFLQVSKIQNTNFLGVLNNIFSILLKILKLQHERSLEKKSTIARIMESELDGTLEKKYFHEITTVNAILNLTECIPENERASLFLSVINFFNKLTMTSKSGFQIAIRFLKHFIASGVLTNSLLKVVLKSEVKLLKVWFLHYDETIEIFDLIAATVEPVHQLEGKEDILSEFSKILSKISKTIDDKKCGPFLTQKFVSLLVLIIKINYLNPEKINISEESRDHLLYFIEFLKSPFHEVRMKTTEYLPVLFSSELCLMSKYNHSGAFELALKYVEDLFIVRETRSSEDLREEGQKRSHCALKILLGFISSSYIWRRKALYRLFAITSLKNISPTLFRKVHLYMEKSLQVDNAISFLEHNLDFVLWSWYQEFKSFQNFPFSFMNYESLQAFLKEYKVIIVPIFLENNDREGFETLCTELSLSQTEIAISCFPEIIACLLPKLGGDLQHADRMHAFILKLIDHNMLKKLITSEIHKILLAVYMKLNDSEHFKHLCTMNIAELPASTPLNITLGGVDATLNYMQRTSPDPQQCLLVLLCKEYPRHIEFIMHSLLTNISLASTKEIRLLCFLQYITVCDTIAGHLESVGKMAGFVIWHTLNALIHLCQTDLSLPAASYLLGFLERCFLNHTHYVDYLLDLIFPYVMDLSEKNGDAGVIGEKIKNLFILKKHELLRIAAYLPLEDTTASLEEEFNIFIRRLSPDVLALERLLAQLSLRKKELASLYEKLKKLHCISDDCSRSVLHQLLAKLVKLATSSNQSVRTWASRCLGRIGPKNLNTLSLQPESSTSPPPLADKILKLLLPLIVDNDPDVSEAASNAVSELLKTEEGKLAYGKLSSIEKHFLIPFVPRLEGRSDKIPKDFDVERLRWASVIRVLGSSSDGWAMWSGGDHVAWVKSVTSRFLDAFTSGLLPLLAPLALKQQEMCEELLPYIVNIIIEESPEPESDGLRIVQSNLAYFFKRHFELRNSLEKIEDDTLIYVNRKSVLCMLSIVDFFRFKNKSLSITDRPDHHRKLNLNYLNVAYAAQFCRAYFTSLMYIDHWVDSLREKFKSIPYSSTSVLLDEVYKKYPEDGLVLLNLLWENYKSLGEHDSLASCVRLQLGDPSIRIRYFHEMGCWQNLIAEAELSNDKEALAEGLLMSGLFTCVSHFNNSSYDAAWRLARWDLEPQITGSDNFSSLHYSALKSALHLKEKDNSLAIIDSARSVVLRDLAHASLEVASSLYLPLSKLQLIYELENWCTEGEHFEEDFPVNDWAHVEPLLWQRCLLASDPLLCLKAAKVARSNSSQLIAQRFLKNVEKLNPTKSLLDEMKLEEAQTHWCNNNFETAKHMLKILLDQIENPFLKAKCLITYGSWMSETKSEAPKGIIENYFKTAAKLLSSDGKNRLIAAESLAKYADCEYQRIQQYLDSPEYELKKTQLEQAKKSLQSFSSLPSEKLTFDERKSARIHSINIKVDESELQSVRQEHLSFLQLAVREYLYCLQYDETSGDKMYRFVSLWLKNKNSTLKELDLYLHKVPSYRFIPAFPQLAVRISMDDEHFNKTLKKLLYRVTEDHPHHCLWHLLALANADYEKGESISSPQSRVLGATNILKELQKTKSLGSIVPSMQELALAYISLANIDLKEAKATNKPCDLLIPRNEKIRKIKNLNHISCASMNIKVNKSADYSNIIGIVNFGEKMSTVGGINAPRRIVCHCTDGTKKLELVKGFDDLRQDALMQQVFSVLNNLLESDNETMRRKLNVRTYKVVPMTQKCGVIEWCSGTEPIRDCLIEMHRSFRPQDMSPDEARNLIAQATNRDAADKLKIFLQICANLKPAMRYFFYEQYDTPGVWFEKKLVYTRSVATNSMIGYVMGIGDRHVSNILIDKKTAELVHIDFGVAFELAKILPTPETVPFRLTRDIEDGMGITGVEGVFRKCCEETMRVLRKKSEPILTTLEMLLYEPLYSWSVKPRIEHSQQNIPDISTEETNKLAERFVHRLKLKLAGREEGETSSVEAQVRNLIQEAKDPKNLCRLYRGWQAYF